MPYLRSCAKCGNEFLSPIAKPPPVYGKHYCSRECWYSRNYTTQTPRLRAVVCANCGQSFPIRGTLAERKYCSVECYRASLNLEGGANWRGGRWLARDKGYLMISLGGQKRAAEHTLIAERALGRSLRKDELVHHVNGEKTDNRPSNLVVCTRKYHAELHSRMAFLWMQEKFGGR